MSKTPFMPLWVADFLAKTPDLDAKETGAYLLILMALWTHGGRLPNDPRKLQRIARCGREWPKVWGAIERFFDVADGEISQGRLTEELQKVNAKLEVNAHNGARGGLAKALKNKEAALANATISLKQPEPYIPEAKASGASAPSSFHDAIWTRGVLFLIERGVTEKQARSFLGRAKKQHGDEAVFNALASAAKAGAVDPIPYITKALQSAAHPEAQKLEAWGIPDAQPVRPLPRIEDIDPKKPPGAPDMPELQREQEEENREMSISNADTRGHSDILPPLRAQCGSAA